MGAASAEALHFSKAVAFRLGHTVGKLPPTLAVVTALLGACPGGLRFFGPPPLVINYRMRGAGLSLFSRAVCLGWPSRFPAFLILLSDKQCPESVWKRKGFLGPSDPRSRWFPDRTVRACAVGLLGGAAAAEPFTSRSQSFRLGHF